MTTTNKFTLNQPARELTSGVSELLTTMHEVLTDIAVEHEEQNERLTPRT